MVEVKVVKSDTSKTNQVINKIKYDTDKIINITFYAILLILLFVPRLAWRVVKAVVKIIAFFFEAVITIIADIFSGW